MIKIAGIDLGSKGAICISTFTDDLQLKEIEFYPLNGAWDPYGKEGKDLVKAWNKAKEILDYLSLLKGIDEVYIEDVKPYKGMAANSVFSFSGNIKIVYGILSLLNIPFNSIHASVWQKVLNLSTKSSDKEKHKEEIAKSLFEIYPQTKNLVYSKQGKLLDGYTDALGIMHYGLLQIKKGTKND